MSALNPAGDADRNRQLEAENALLKKRLSVVENLLAETIDSRDAWRREATLDPDDDAASPADLIKQLQRRIRFLEELNQYLLERMPVELTSA